MEVKYISENKSNRHYILGKVDLYEVCAYYIFLWSSLLYYDYANIQFLRQLLVPLKPGPMNSGSIGCCSLIQNSTRVYINGGGQSC